MNTDITNYIIAGSALAQGAFTFVIAMVTIWYARSTRDLVDLQIEPSIKLDIPSDILAGGRSQAAVINDSGCEVIDVSIMVSVPCAGDADEGMIMQCINTMEYPRLKARERQAVQCVGSFDHAREVIRVSDLDKKTQSMHSAVTFDISCRRKADSKPFYLSEYYHVFKERDGSLRVARTHYERKTSHDRWIVRPIEK